MTSRSIKYKKGYKYQLVEDAVTQTKIRPEKNIITRFITLAMDGTLTVYASYAWDGPSGPTIDTKSSMMPSLFHDAKYQLMRLLLIPLACREIADDEFYDDCIYSEMNRYRAAVWTTCLRGFAENSALPASEPKTFIAP